MSKLSRRPKRLSSSETPNKFSCYGLQENPFPSVPMLNTEAEDRRINGGIFEMDIREREHTHIINHFLKQPQTNPSHFRLGYIMDTSYIGRGNGKSAFVVNVINEINKDFCMDISDEQNRCFALRIVPESGGRTKTFLSFMDLLFSGILKSGMVDNCLASLRLDAINNLCPHKIPGDISDEELIQKMLSEDWFKDQSINTNIVNQYILRNKYLQSIPDDFPLKDGVFNLFCNKLASSDDFKKYYENIKKSKDKWNFIFSDLVSFFEAGGFNGCYIFVDDFERIPDFQSAQQKKDFAREIRSCLFDGPYRNSNIGFYNLFLVLHAGVHRLIEEAWGESGLEARVPIAPSISSNHIIKFEKLNGKHVEMLLKTYLDAYRDKEKFKSKDLGPFSAAAIAKISTLAEYNATNILRMAYSLLNHAADEGVSEIDGNFVNDFTESGLYEQREDRKGKEISPVNLGSKARALQDG